MIRNPIIPIILCGGTGTRLWPLSRKSYPKQFLSIFSDNKNSLLQKTQNRLNGIENIINPIIVCNEEHRFIVGEQMNAIGIKPLSIMLEPFGRNTAAAITIAALKSIQYEKDPYLLVVSSDHEIKIEEEFIKTVNHSLKYADLGNIITFGVLPTYPETGYGYIKGIEPFPVSKEIKGIQISKFIEKPDIKSAEKFIKDRHYSWNSGIFIFKAKTILNEVKNFAPKVLKYCSDSIKKEVIDLDFQRLDSKAFKKVPNISIDVAVMENTKLGIVLPFYSKWSDVGNWKSVWENETKDKNNSVIIGPTYANNVKNSYLRSENRLLVGIGIKNLIVVETNDAVLIANMTEAQNIKKVVEDLNKKNLSEAELHRKIIRPWGSYISIAEEENWKVKRIEVKKGASLSLQSHKYRAEHWIVVKGVAKVEIEKKIFYLEKNQSTYIPIGAKHRLSNEGNETLTLIEVQSGSYLEEDDIERFEDIYGRLHKI